MLEPFPKNFSKNPSDLVAGPFPNIYMYNIQLEIHLIRDSSVRVIPDDVKQFGGSNEIPRDLVSRPWRKN